MEMIQNWCFLGFSDDQGVRNVGGRPGASEGPAAFRRIFMKFKDAHPIHGQAPARMTEKILTPKFADLKQQLDYSAGELAQLQATHSRSVVVGGGHDYGYAQLAGIKKTLTGTKKRLGCINIDAHFDLRPTTPVMSSGAPYRLALEEGVIEATRFIEFGIQLQSNSKELWQYAKTKKIRTVPLSQIRTKNAVAIFRTELLRLSRLSDAIVLSIDLDAMAQSECPGVSAPQAEGISVKDLIAMAEIAGRNPKVVSLGLFELSPPWDRDDQTARVAATVAYRFLTAT